MRGKGHFAEARDFEMQPRLRLDIGWRDLASVLLPGRLDRLDLVEIIKRAAPVDTTAVVGLSVRSLFDALLSETPKTAQVVLSAVTIQDMAALVRAHDREVRSMDIDIATLFPTPNAISEACGRDAGLIVVAHLYGGRSPIAPLAQAATSPERLVVEDCAQAFDGELTLSDGADVALYSFGPIKKATALGGSIGLFRDAALARRVEARLEQNPILPDSWLIKRVMKFACLKLLGTPWMYALLLATLKRLGKDPEPFIGTLARGFPGASSIADAVRFQPPARLLRLLGRRLRLWSPRPDATPALLDRLAARLTVPGIANRPRHWWLAPIVTSTPESVISALRDSGYDATRGTTSMRAIADDTGRIPERAKELIEHVVYVPKPANAKEAERLAAAVEAAVSRT
jgi:perosamine synthetase